MPTMAPSAPLPAEDEEPQGDIRRGGWILVLAGVLLVLVAVLLLLLF